MMAILMMVFMWVFGVIVPVVGLILSLYWALEKSTTVIHSAFGFFGYLLVGLPVYYVLMLSVGEVIFGQ